MFNLTEFTFSTRYFFKTVILDVSYNYSESSINFENLLNYSAYLPLRQENQSKLTENNLTLRNSD